MKQTLKDFVQGIETISWKNACKTNYNYIDLTAVNRDNHLIENCDIITAETAPSRAKQIVRIGDVLFATTRPLLKRVCIVPKEFDGDICSTGFCVLRLKKNTLTPQWVFYTLLSKSFYQYIEPLQKGVAYPAVSSKEVLNYSCSIPSMEEQERIVEELDLLSGIIEKQKQQLKELDTLAQSIFYDTFGDPITNEKNWPVKKLGEVGMILTGSTPSTTDKSNWDGDVNWVTPAELGTQLYYGNTVRKITEKAAKKLTVMPIGTVLLSSRAPIGKLAITTESMCCNQGFKNIFCGKKLNNIYLYYCLYFSMDNIKALGRGATFKEVSKSAISSFPIILPPLSLQEQFAEKIEMIEKQKEAIGKSIKETQLLFDYTMDKYFG